MSHRSVSNFWYLLSGAVLLMALGFGCSSEQTAADGAKSTDSLATDTTAVYNTDQAVPEPSWIITPSPDSPDELQRKIQKIYGWYPMHKERLDWMLKDVDKVTFYSDLGLGDRTEIVMPARPTTGWPVGHSIKLGLAGEKTALAIRLQVDTLAGPRAMGEGVLGLFALHCSETLGRDVTLEREQSGTGRLDLQMLRDLVVVDLACCDIPPTFLLRGYGDFVDTLTFLVVFEKQRQRYSIHFLGPLMVKSYPGLGYKMFRTERGEFHKEETAYPYICRNDDPDYINLLIGSRWRGRKSISEPILKATLF